MTDAAWLGLVPRQYSTGGKSRLGRITKCGDFYLRTLLVHRARAALTMMAQRDDRLAHWTRSLVERRGFKKACVGLAEECAHDLGAARQGGRITASKPPRRSGIETHIAWERAYRLTAAVTSVDEVTVTTGEGVTCAA